ncbi:MAG: peptide deformylase [Thermogutta sp.]
MSYPSKRLELVRYPHPTLRYTSKAVRKMDSELLSLIGEMFQIMYANNGIGLAANQVDLPYRIFVINLTADPAEKSEELVFINPEIIRRSGVEEGEEGCLSLPYIRGVVRRSKDVEILAYNQNGEELHWRISGLLARAFQHELDHLNGVLFVDHLARSERLAIRLTLEEWEREYQSALSKGQERSPEDVMARLKELEMART